jgi:hydroxymethylpyrimidine/phosphomethylpyrimidine kinase
VHGTCAITAVTAQNTLTVGAIHQLPPEIVLAQIRTVVSDIGVDAVKVGMLGSAAVALAVAEAIDELPAGTPVVVDPVIVAESGARLLAADAQDALVREILPRASVLTPNLPEARVLAGRDPVEAVGGRQQSGQTPSADEDAEVLALARAVLALGPRVVVLTGGHRSRAVDVFVDAEHAAGVPIEGDRHPDGAAHGSGCTHSSLLAAQLALGHTPLEAARTARALAGAAVAHGLRDVGAGAGPVDVLDIASMRAR